MKHVPVIALFALSACQTGLPQAPQGSVVIANTQYGFQVAVPQEVAFDPSGQIEGGQAFKSDADGIRMAVWGAPMPVEGLVALAAADRDRTVQSGAIITFQETDVDGFEFWATTFGTQVIVQSTEVGVDCAGTPIIATYFYAFDKDRTPGELRYLTSDETFPRFNFAANCP